MTDDHAVVRMQLERRSVLGRGLEATAALLDEERRELLAALVGVEVVGHRHRAAVPPQLEAQSAEVELAGGALRQSPGDERRGQRVGGVERQETRARIRQLLFLDQSQPYAEVGVALIV